jgi:hypothetical protein
MMPLWFLIKRTEFKTCVTRFKVQSIAVENTPPLPQMLFKNLSKYVFGTNNDGDLWTMCVCNLWPNYGTQMLMANKGTHFVNKIFFNINCSDS